MKNKPSDFVRVGFHKGIPYNIFNDTAVLWEDIVPSAAPNEVITMLFKVQSGNWAAAPACGAPAQIFWEKQLMHALAQNFKCAADNFKTSLPPPEWNRLLKDSHGDEKAAVLAHAHKILAIKTMTGVQQILTMAQIGNYQEQFGGVEAHAPYRVCCFCADGRPWDPAAQKNYNELIVPLKAWARGLCYRVETPLTTAGGFLGMDPYNDDAPNPLNNFVRQEINKLLKKTHLPYAIKAPWAIRPHRKNQVDVSFDKTRHNVLFAETPEQLVRLLNVFEGKAKKCKATANKLPELLN